jgi:DNA-directed RNA polymerase specialized sigma24 family protein
MTSLTSQGQDFADTRWSMVFSAAHSSTPHGAKALDELCRQYWYPVYAFIRHKGTDAPGAEDLTQSFFQILIERNILTYADPARGRFRSFLCAAVQRVMTDEWNKSNTLKRGGGKQITSWDALKAEDRYRHEPVNSASPDQIFDRTWAQTVASTVMGRLRQECSDVQAVRFDLVKGFLVKPTDRTSVIQAASAAGISENAMKALIARMRSRYRELFRREIERTVESSEEVDIELRHIAKMLSQ